MITTELIKILKDNECGAITHKPREISLTINGKYMPNPQITLSSTGDGICGAEIDLDVNGEFFAEQEPCGDCITIPKDATFEDVIKIIFPHCEQKEHINNGYFEMYFDNNLGNASYMKVSKEFWNAPYKREVEEDGKSD